MHPALVILRYAKMKIIKHLDCGGIINKYTGVLTSPQYPNASDEAVECVWTIVAPEGPGDIIAMLLVTELI